jgi:hypothetical protein
MTSKTKTRTRTHHISLHPTKASVVPIIAKAFHIQVVSRYFLHIKKRGVLIMVFAIEPYSSTSGW